MRTLTPEEHEQELALARHVGRTERGERVRVLATRGVRTFPGHLETCQKRVAIAAALGGPPSMHSAGTSTSSRKQRPSTSALAARISTGR